MILEKCSIWRRWRERERERERERDWRFQSLFEKCFNEKKVCCYDYI